MRNVVIPHNVPSDVQRAFQQVNLALQELCVPLLNKESSLSGIAEGTRAHFMEGDKLYRYTKINGKLFKEEVSEHFEEGSRVDVLRQVEYTPEAPRQIVVDYMRSLDSPRAVSFGTAWHRLLDDGVREPLLADEIPTDISFDPLTPSSDAGKHYVTVTFTPPDYGDADRIIGSVIVEEA